MVSHNKRSGQQVWAGMREGGLPLPRDFQYLILLTWSACDLNLAIISSLDSKWQVLKVGMPVFQLFYEMKLKTSKSWHFEVSEDIMIFRSQGLHIIRIKYWNASGCGSPTSLIPAHCSNIGILHYKQAKLRKYMQHSVWTLLSYSFLVWNTHFFWMTYFTHMKFILGLRLFQTLE